MTVRVNSNFEHLAPKDIHGELCTGYIQMVHDINAAQLPPKGFLQLHHFSVPSLLNSPQTSHDNVKKKE